jgi:hypothetical protein
MQPAVFGIRHHGPGSARSVRRALEALAPNLVLVEGPPDADAVLPLAADPAMRPPVALLVYRPDAPRRAVFYPFAEFSPEWQAIQFAQERGVPVRFMDLPLTIQFAREETRALLPGEEGGEAKDGAEEPTVAETGRVDPLTALAAAAGYDDHELWWEHQVERRQDAAGIFEAISEAMQALRAETTISERDLTREAFMRQTIRAAVKQGHERIAVVCGAWHAPALTESGSVKADMQLLKGLPKTKVEVAWIPWTYSRLSYRSGYGAGVDSPGWYHHLWLAPERAPVRWLVEAARLLRDEDLEASSASVIDAARLADALASMRDLAGPGLPELREAALSVYCRGQHAPLQLIRSRLEIGSVIGEVPEAATIVPLQRDLRDTQRRLRLKVSEEVRTLDLDLRKDIDRDRSVLFHRLNLLGLDWATPQQTSGGIGTFHELWQLRWKPEMEVALVEASVWGSTIGDASSASSRHTADATGDIAELTALLDRVILSDLTNAIDHLLARVQERAALSSDVRRLMAALSPLARVSRYGDVRKTPTERLRPVIDGLFERVLVGMPLAGVALDDDAAEEMVEAMSQLQQAIDLLERTDEREQWLATLRGLSARDAVHPLVRGYCCRLLVEQQQLDEAELGRLSSLALSPAVAAEQAAAWLTGLLRGTGLVLVHHEAVWSALDRWLVEVPLDRFPAMLPLVRRAFAGFSPPERRAMGEKIARMAPGESRLPKARDEEMPIDMDRASQVLPVFAKILGVRRSV